MITLQESCLATLHIPISLRSRKERGRWIAEILETWCLASVSWPWFVSEWGYFWGGYSGGKHDPR
jgi:hypothetical protein